MQRLQTELAASSATPATSARIKLEMIQPLVFLGRTGEAEVTARQGMEAAGPAGLAGVVNDQAWSLAMNRRLMRRSDGPAVARLAAELAARAVELDAKNPLALNTLGVACYRTGDLTSCVKHLEESLAAGAEVGRNYFFLAMAQQQLGNRDAAAGWWDKGMKRVDQNPRRPGTASYPGGGRGGPAATLAPIPPASTPR